MKIAIVGAGPAGCHLAHSLTDTEHEILLFDHRVRPYPASGYEKPCGGGLSPIVGQQFPDLMALPFARHRPPGVLLRASDGSQVERRLGAADWAIVSRAEFGQVLLGRALANGRVRFIRQRVTGVERTGEAWSVRTAAGETFSAEFLVGADGVRSLVRRVLVGPIPERHLGLTVGYRVRGAPEDIIFQTYSDLEGYLWSFPRVDHASVGIWGRMGAYPAWDLWQRVDRFLAEECPEARVVKHWAGLLPMAQDRSLWEPPCTGPGWVLLGDAAAHVNPMTGEGIAYALWSAELLAQAFRQGDPQVYEGLWREGYGRGLLAACGMLRRVARDVGAYEKAFQVAMAAALPLPV